MTEKKRRLTLKIPTATSDRLEDLQEKTEAESLTEVIRRALLIYEFLLTKNAECILRFPDGTEKNLIIK